MSKHKFSKATGRALHKDALLTNMALGYTPRMGIGDRIFPMVQVQKQSDSYIIHDRADAIRLSNAIRSPGKEANIIEQSISDDQYYCKNRALKMALTIEDRENSDPAYISALINGRAQFIIDKLALDTDKRVADIVTNTSNVGGNAGASSPWTNLANADAMGDVWGALEAVEDTTGQAANRIAFGGEAWRNFRRNEALRNNLFGTDNGGGNATVEQVKALFGVEEILIGNSFINTANEADPLALSRVWGDDVLVYFAPMMPSIEVPSYGYAFRWSAPGLANMSVERHPYDSRTKTEEIEVGYYQDEKVTAKEYSFLITAVNAP